MTAFDLSVVIVSYNTRELLRACLESLLRQPCPCEIIVVDNASADGSPAMIREAFPQVRLLAQPRNTWYCGGNNIGIAAASAGYVLLLNPDTVVEGEALATMRQFLAEHPHYAGVTCQLRYPSGTIQRTGSRVPTLAYLLANHTPLLLLAGWRRRLSERHWYTDWARTTDRDVGVAPGSCLMLRRDDALLDAGLWLYFPEDDLARRLGLPFRYLASVHIAHHEKSSTRSWLATRIYFRDLLVYVGRHHGLLAWLLMWALTRPLLLAMWLKARRSASRKVTP
jgi:hypothetical protein